MAVRLQKWHAWRAGFLAEALFRSTRGPKAAAIAGGVGTVAASLLVAGRQYLDKNL